MKTRSNFKKFKVKKDGKSWCAVKISSEGHCYWWHSLDKYEAQDVCDYLNQAYKMGREDYGRELDKKGEEFLNKNGV